MLSTYHHMHNETKEEAAMHGKDTKFAARWNLVVIDEV